MKIHGIISGVSSFGVEYHDMAADADLYDPYLNTILLYSQFFAEFILISA
jgi:hypothetical protein